MFAVIKTGGKQYKVASGDFLRVERIAADAGETVLFNEVMMLGGDDPKVGAPLIEDAGVEAEVVDQIKGEKVIHFVKRRRKHSSKRTKGHRQKLTLVKIGDIMASGAGKSKAKAAIGTGSVSASIVSAMEERYTMNRGDQAEMKKRVVEGEAEEKSAKPVKTKKDAPKKATKAAEGDDLTKITGVGPVMVEKLNGEGVTSFEEIANWSDKDVERIEDALSMKGRVGREDWIAQAKELIKG